MSSEASALPPLRQRQDDERELDAGAGAERVLPWPRRAFAIGAILSAMVMVVLDAGITNLALATIARSVHIAPATAVLVTTVYQTALVMALLPAGALGERFGHARVFRMGVVLFVAASALCALSPSFTWLLVARFAQGLGGAAVLALGVALLRLSVSDRQLGAAISWNALTVALSTAAGPVIGALALSNLHWSYIYALNAPLGVAILFAARALPHSNARAAPLDMLGFTLNGAGFGLLIFGATQIVAKPWQAAIYLGVAAALLIILVRREWNKTTPVIPIDLLRNGAFSLAILASICCFTGQTIALVALPFYLQHGLQQSTAAAGLYMTPWPLSVAVAAIVVGRLADNAPNWLLCALGGVALTLGLAGMGLWPLQGALHWIVVFAVLCGLGFGLFQTPNNRTMFMSAPAARSGAAGGMQGTARLLGQTLGAVIMSSIFMLVTIDAAPRMGLLLGAGFTLLAAIISALRSKPS